MTAPTTAVASPAAAAPAPTFSATCSRCGHVHTSTTATHVGEWWGRAPETMGYGPTPRCVNLVPHWSGNGTLQVCGGSLNF